MDRCRKRKKAYSAEIIEKVNGVFEVELTDGDQLLYVGGVLKDQLLEEQMLIKRSARSSSTAHRICAIRCATPS
ncbi:hypothetical protein CtCNB1_0018 [Comamonas thiooxydans]|nr:hypothetical protein CtCNB1_0018 [Comamonas thiooxydans]